MKNILLNHIRSNLKEYICIAICLIIGITAGVVFINCTNDVQKEEISSYITSFTNFIKNVDKIDKVKLLIESLKQNFFLLFSLWFFGCTVVGFPIIYLIILYRGFCLGYTISSITAVYSSFKGIVFIFASLFIQNIVLIPAIFLISVSGIKLYKTIMQTKTKENIKFEILRHTCFLILSIILGIISSFLEILVSTNLLIALKNIL